MENNNNLEQNNSQIEGEENNNIDINNKEQNNINYKGEMEGREEYQNQSQEQNPEVEQEGEGEENVQQEMEEGANQEVEQEGGEEEGQEEMEEGGGIYDSNYNNYCNNKKLSNKERIELINNKLKINLNAKKMKNINNNNIHENIIDEDKGINYENINSYDKNNILSDLLNKIQNFKKNKRNMGTKLNLNSNNNFDALDKELTNALSKLNNKSSKINDIPNVNILNEEPKVDRQFNRNVLRNPKFKEIMSLINEKDIKRSNKYNNMGKCEIINFMNTKIKYNNNFSDINIFVPKKNTAPNLLSNMTYNSKIRKNNNDKYYISCIDGKAIVHGIRKEVPFLSKFNNNDNRIIINNNNKALNNFDFTFGKSTRRNSSLKFNKNIEKNEFSYEKSLKNKKYNKNSGMSDLNFNKIKNDFTKENLNNKLNKMNDYYFQREFKFLK